MMKLCFELFAVFFRIGGMTFGGGYAMLPILERELVENRKWCTEEELADYYAIGQCTPGIIAVNTATFIGRKRGGLAGALAATAGVVAPGAIIICLIASLISNFADIKWVADAFAGIRACVCVLIFNAVLKLMKAAVVDKTTVAIFAAVLAASLLTPLSPAVFVVAAAAAGIAAQAMKSGGAKK
jgi:chromate transporter